MSRVAGFAVTPIRFGEDIIEPGEPVPYEPGRNYSQMVRLGQLAPYRGEAPAIAEPQPAARSKAPARSRSASRRHDSDE